MAIELDTSSTPTLVDKGSIPTTAVPFCTNGIEADATTAKEIVAAPGSGKHNYITRIILQSEVAGVDPQIQDDDATVLFGPYATATSGACVDVSFPRPIKAGDNDAIDVKAAGAGALFVFIEGFAG